MSSVAMTPVKHSEEMQPPKRYQEVDAAHRSDAICDVDGLVR